MLRRGLPLILSAAALVAAGVFVALLATTPADCGRVSVRAADWTAAGVLVDAEPGCPLGDGDLVTAIDGRPTAADRPRAEVEERRIAVLTVVRDGQETRVPVTLSRPDVLGPLVAAWPTMLFVWGLLALAAYAAAKRLDATTGALLVFGAGLAASTVPTVLGLPTVGVQNPELRGLYLGLTQVVYLTAWCGVLAFNLIFPRPFPRLAHRPRALTWLLATAPLWVTAGWAALVAPSSADHLQWTGRVIAGGSIVVVGTLLSLATLMVVRLRHTRDALELQQVRWLVGTGVLAIVTGLVGWFLPSLLLGAGLPTGWIGLTGLPFVVGLAVALTRHRLFDLEPILNRGLVYGLLTTVVATLYIVVVAVVGNVLQDGSTTPASIAAAVVVAVAVNPIRLAIQQGVGKILYGDRDDPYSALSRLGRRFDAAGGDLLPAIARDVADAFRAPYAAIDVPAVHRRVETGDQPRWASGETDLVAVPLVDRAERVGTLLLAPRSPGAPYSRADRLLLEDLARRVAAAVRELTLRTDLQHSRERLVLAREEERRRLRRALHDELGPAIAGLGLRTEAARRLVPTDPAKASDALAAVREGTQELVSDVRRLAYDLRPPALDDLGLAGALRQHASTVDRPPVTVSAQQDLGPLPAAVETAAYRIAVEAVTNTVRHADARSCCVQLSRLDGALHVTVTDDGTGPPPDVLAGVGLTAMRERAAELGGTLRVAAEGGGTTVVATLPLGREAR